MKRKKSRNSKLMIAANMPPLYHTVPGQPYHFKKSEVLKWLAERPALIEYIFNQASNAKEIVFNPETGKWQGVDWEDDE